MFLFSETVNFCCSFCNQTIGIKFHNFYGLGLLGRMEVELSVHDFEVVAHNTF